MFCVARRYSETVWGVKRFLLTKLGGDIPCSLMVFPSRWHPSTCRRWLTLVHSRAFVLRKKGLSDKIRPLNSTSFHYERRAEWDEDPVHKRSQDGCSSWSSWFYRHTFFYIFGENLLHFLLSGTQHFSWISVSPTRSPGSSSTVVMRINWGMWPWLSCSFVLRSRISSKLFWVNLHLKSNWNIF